MKINTCNNWNWKLIYKKLKMKQKWVRNLPWRNYGTTLARKIEKESRAWDEGAQNRGAAPTEATPRRWPEDDGGSDGGGWWQRRWQGERQKSDARCSKERVRVCLHLCVVRVVGDSGGRSGERKRERERERKEL